MPAMENLEQRIAALESDLARTREVLDRVDDWADGIMGVLLQVLPVLLKKDPKLAETLMPMWERNERLHELAVRGTAQEMSAGWYEPQAILAGVCRSAGIPSPSGRGGPPGFAPTPPDVPGNGSPPYRGRRRS